MTYFSESQRSSFDPHAASAQCVKSEWCGGGRATPGWPRAAKLRNYPQMRIIPKLSRIRNYPGIILGSQTGSLWSYWFSVMTSPLSLDFKPLPVDFGPHGLEIALIGYWTLHLLFNNAAKIRSKHIKLCLTGIVWTKMGLLAFRKCSGAKRLPVRPRHKMGTGGVSALRRLNRGQVVSSCSKHSNIWTSPVFLLWWTFREPHDSIQRARLPSASEQFGDNSRIIRG